MPYRSPFITETDEPAFTDCQFCRWADARRGVDVGRGHPDRHGTTLDAVGLKRLRERIRVVSGDTEGGASLEDLARGIARRFPDLPALPRTTAPVDPLRLSFDELWLNLQSGHCVVLDGNPIKVRTPRARCARCRRRTTTTTPSSSTPHAVSGPSSWTRSVAADTRASGSRRWTCASSPRAFTTASGSPYCAVVKRGHQSSVERLRRETSEQTRGLQTELATAKAAVTTARAQALRDAARAVAAVPR